MSESYQLRPRLYVCSSGSTARFSPAHAFAWLIVDSAGNVAWSNREAPAAYLEGITNAGYYAALLEAVRLMPEGTQFDLVLKKGHELEGPFGSSRAERSARNYRRPNPKNRTPYAFESLMREIDAAAVGRRIEFTVRQPQDLLDENFQVEVYQLSNLKWQQAYESFERGLGKFC